MSLSTHPHGYKLYADNWIANILSISGVSYSKRHFELVKSSTKGQSATHIVLGIVELLPVIGAIVAIFEKVIVTSQKQKGHHSSHPNHRPPIGFNNYGASCWFSTPLQAVLAHKNAEELIRKPLVRNMAHLTVEREFKNDRYSRWIAITRPETDEELNNRKNIQEALIHVIEQRKQGNSKGLEKATKELHHLAITRNPKFKKIGSASNSSETFSMLENVFDDFYHKRVGKSEWLSPILPLHPSETQLDCAAKKDLRLIALTLDDTITCNLANPLIFSTPNGKDLPYRIVSWVREVPGHYIAYINKDGQWYCCNDGDVKKAELTSIDIGQRDSVILEQI